MKYCKCRKEIYTAPNHNAQIYTHKNMHIYLQEHLFLTSARNKKFWEELITYFPLVRHGSHRRRRVKQFFYCCVCIRCHGNFFIELLPIKGRSDAGTNTQADEVRLSDGLKCHNLRTEFHKDWFTHPKFDKGNPQTHSMEIAYV
jgi:hypothetical protein